ncbi:MAG: protein-tyrosine-phosphatase [Bacteroidetes bacterium]|nr:MAG: protein-tyrosine-phosphatase [Bacteroidota bacterium]
MLLTELQAFLGTSSGEGLSAERQELWQKAAQAVVEKEAKAMNFICTHNARRSVISQSLAAALAHQYGFSEMQFYSGGAESTFIHPNSLALLQKIGFEVKEVKAGNNPVNTAGFASDAQPLQLFSKTFDDASSSEPYVAILVCSKGDAACPFIPDAKARILIPFEDPGAYDGTEQAAEAYLATAKLILNELHYFFQLLPSSR